MDVQVAAEPHQNSLSDAEMLGFRTILSSLEFDVLITIIKIIKRSRRTNANTNGEAIEIILGSARSAIVILGRQKVTKRMIRDYLIFNGQLPQLPNNMSKLELSNKCLEFWKTTQLYQELDQGYRNLVEEFFAALDTPQNPDLDDNENRCQYCEAIRIHILDNCQLMFVLPNYGTEVVPEEFSKNGFEEVIPFLFSLKYEKKISLQLNEERDSLCAERDPHGWVKINIPGISHRENNSGTFDLILTYAGRKIKDIILTIDGYNIPEVPPSNIMRMDSLIESSQASQIDEVTPRDQEIRE